MTLPHQTIAVKEAEISEAKGNLKKVKPSEYVAIV
jgi:hypothetical protein